LLGVAAGNVLVVFLVIEAILFGLFTCCMMLDQWTVVSTNTTSKTWHTLGQKHGTRREIT
jgi:uncharacterized membrane protein (Fun14 family)